MDRTRPVYKSQIWELTGNDRTLGSERPVTCAGASGHLMTVEIGHSAFEAKNDVAAIRGPNTGGVRLVNLTGASG